MRPSLTDFAIELTIEHELCPAVILLMKQGHIGSVALVADAANPVFIHDATLVLGSPLTAGNHPVELTNAATEVNRTEQRFRGHEADGGRNPRDNIQSRDLALIFNSRAQPDVRVTFIPITGQPILNELGTLGENQPVEVVARSNDLPRFVAPGIGSGMEKVRHRTREDSEPLLCFACLPVPRERLLPSRLGAIRSVERFVP